MVIQITILHIDVLEMRPICNNATFYPSYQDITQSLEDIDLRRNVLALIDDTLLESINIRIRVSVPESFHLDRNNNPRC